MMQKIDFAVFTIKVFVLILILPHSSHAPNLCQINLALLMVIHVFVNQLLWIIVLI